jgi:hypothetical protein
LKLKKRLQNSFYTVNQKLKVLAVKVKLNTMSTREVLSNNRGASALEIALASVIAVVLGVLLLNSFTGIFNDTVIPKITTSITGMFS